MNERGELTSSQIIGIVLAVAGFIIVLLFVSLLYDNSNAEKDRELCRLSVLTRATAPSALQAAVPLKCMTEKVCISYSGKKDACPQFLGEENVQYVTLKKETGDNRLSSRAENVKTVEQELALGMLTCWNMMGKGKLDLFGTGSEQLGLDFDSGKATCVVCSRVALAQDVIDANVTDDVHLNTYLQSNLVPPENTMSFIDAFTDRATQSYPKVSDVESYVSKEEKRTLEGNPSTNQFAIVFSQNKPTSWQNVAKNWGYLMVGSAVPAAKGGLYTLGAVTLTEAGVGFIGGINQYFSQGAAASYCGQFTSNEGNSEGGCSLIQTISYNVRDVNALCNGGIQGIP